MLHLLLLVYYLFIFVQPKFAVIDYMSKQTEVTPQMRATLVDWMVEIQVGVIIHVSLTLSNLYYTGEFRIESRNIVSSSEDD
jgi:hypothetical protein